MVSTEEVYEHIKENPGITGKQLIEAFDISYQNLTNKIRRLRDGDRIEVEVIRKGRTQRRHYYPFGDDGQIQDPEVVDSRNQSVDGPGDRVQIDPEDYEELFQLATLQSEKIQALNSELEKNRAEIERLNAHRDSLQETVNAFVMLTEISPEEAMEKAERRVKIILRYGNLQAAFEKANDTIKQQAAIIRQLKQRPQDSPDVDTEGSRAEAAALKQLYEEEKAKNITLQNQVAILMRERDTLRKQLEEKMMEE